MKKLTTVLALAIVALFLFSCGKTDNPTPTNTTKYTFTINGNSYLEVAAADSSITVDEAPGKACHAFAVSGVSSDGKAQGEIELIFLGSAKPVAGSYKAIGDV